MNELDFFLKWEQKINKKQCKEFSEEFWECIRKHNSLIHKCPLEYLILKKCLLEY